MISAVAQRSAVLIAVHCGNNFFSCGPDGVCKPDVGKGNHAICAMELHGVETAGSVRDIKIIALNSHGKRFGNNGCYLHTFDHMAGPNGDGPSTYHQHCVCLEMRSSPDEEISTLLN